MTDGLDTALQLVPAAREVDVPLYASLRERKVRFIRCRPFSSPPTLYLRWELACYDFNSAHGEEVLFVASEEIVDLLTNRIHHDFMVFDRSVGFVHDYDRAGEIRGGWETTSLSDITELVEMFEMFRSRCVPYKQFLAQQSA